MLLVPFWFFFLPPTTCILYRAQIEEEYGNQLLELSESSHQIEECFGALLTSSEMSARAHIDLSQNMRNMVELPLQSYVTDQENIKLFVTYEQI